MLVNVFNDFYRLNREMNSLLHGMEAARTQYWPEVNIYENENEYIAVAKVPGFTKEELNINIKDNSLKISGTRNTKKDDDANYHLRERRYGDFERNFLLDEKIDTGSINAELRNGLLLIKIRKSPETKPVKIDIK
jgi:HSP20 family protein